jgi:hypothetical protein
MTGGKHLNPKLETRNEPRTRTAAAVSIPVLVLALFAACPRPGPGKQELFPLKSGSEWQYRLVEYTARSGRNDTTRVGTYTVRVAGSAKAGDSTSVIRTDWQGNEVRVRGPGTDTTYARAGAIFYRLGAHALYRYLKLTSQRESILVLPPQAGQQWHSGISDYLVAGQEDVVIEGRQYPGCWRVNYGPEERLFVSAWYAPGIGLVRQLDEREVYGGVMRSDYYLVRTNLK